MDEFTSIAIWLLIAIVSVNITIGWFANQPTFTDSTLGLQIPGVTDINTFKTTDTNALKDSFYDQNSDACSAMFSDAASVPPCVFQTVGSIFKPITDSFNLVGSVTQDLWNFGFAWTSLLDNIKAQMPTLALFIDIFKYAIAVIEAIAILVVTLRVVAIIRGSG